MNTKLIILDWAGTAVDYGCFAPVVAFALAFRSAGLEATEEEIRQPMGMLKKDHIRTMLAMPRLHEQWTGKYGAGPDEAAVETIYGAFEDSLMRSLKQYAEPKLGVVETVAKLREMGLKIGSTTGYADKMMAVVTENAAKQGYALDAWFSPDSVDGMGRPNLYMIFANMRKFQVSSLADVITMLENEKPLPPKYKDHSLADSRNYKRMRACHIQPD